MTAGDALRGWTLAGIHNAARCGAMTSRVFLAADYADQFDAAWYGACECLLTATGTPGFHEVVSAAQNAVNRHVREERRQHGYRDHGHQGRYDGAPDWTMPNWVKFWANPQHVPSPEDRVVDRIAVIQIIACLTPREREAVEALAAYGDYALAAQAMGIREASLANRLMKARARFLALWHEGEAPSRPWQQDRRRPTRRPAKCGTNAGYTRHITRRERPCEACTAVNREYKRAWKAAKADPSRCPGCGYLLTAPGHLVECAQAA